MGRRRSALLQRRLVRLQKAIVRVAPARAAEAPERNHARRALRRTVSSDDQDVVDVEVAGLVSVVGVRAHCSASGRRVESRR